MLVSIKNLKDFVGKEVVVQGWMFNKRSSGKIIFLELRDGSGETQGIVVEKELPEVFALANGLNFEASVGITGIVSQHPRFPDKFELQIKAIKVFQNPTEEYPIGKKNTVRNFCLIIGIFGCVRGNISAIQRIRHTVLYAIHEFLDREGFTRIDSPIFTPNACEGTTELFPLIILMREKRI